MTPHVLLKTQGLTKIYSGAQPVVAIRNINLTIEHGEFLSIMGQSGSGKTTLMNLLGLLDAPTEGSVYYINQDTAMWNEQQRAHFRNEDIGFIFQAHMLLPEFTALENVLMPIRIARRISPKTINLARELLDRIGLGDRTHHRPAELSGGQNQRVAIARALVNRPKIVFADEPTGALDSQTSLAVYELMRELNREDRITFVIVTHELALAEKTDRIIRLLDGSIQQDIKSSVS